MKRPFLICAIIVSFFASLILILNPASADILYGEDNLIENSAIVISGIALVLSLILLVKRYIKRAGYRFWLIFSILIFLIMGDEVDWGRRYLGFGRYMIAGIAFDGLHDILSIGMGIVKYMRDYIILIGILDIKSIGILTGVIAGIIMLAYFLIGALIKNRERIYLYFSKNLRWEPFLFLVLGLILILIAMIIDDDNLVSFPHKIVIEESLEFLAAVSFLFSSLSGLKLEVYRKYQCMT